MTRTENNLNNGTLTKAGMIRKPIQIRDGIPFMESSVPGCFYTNSGTEFYGIEKSRMEEVFPVIFC